MKYSIIVPVYNTSEFLKDCFESIIYQSITSWEVIVIDDGSTDNSKDIIYDYSRKNNNIKYYYQNNSGLSEARNYGIAKATGDYIIFLDSDDYMAHNALELLDKLIISGNNPDCIMCSFQRIADGDNTPINYEFYFDNNILSKMNVYDGISYLILKEKIILCACMFVVRKDLFCNQQLDFKKGIYHEDVLWIPKMLTKVSHLEFNNDPLFVYRINRTESITNTRNVKRITDKLDIADMLSQEYLQEEKDEALSKMVRLMLSGIEYNVVKEIVLYKDEVYYDPLIKRVEEKLGLLKAGQFRGNIVYYLCKIMGIGKVSMLFRLLKNNL